MEQWEASRVWENGRKFKKKKEMRKGPSIFSPLLLTPVFQPLIKNWYNGQGLKAQECPNSAHSSFAMSSLLYHVRKCYKEKNIYQYYIYIYIWVNYINNHLILSKFLIIFLNNILIINVCIFCHQSLVPNDLLQHMSNAMWCC